MRFREYGHTRWCPGLGLAAQTTQTQKSLTTKSPLMQNWVFRLGWLDISSDSNLNPQESSIDLKYIIPLSAIVFMRKDSKIKKRPDRNFLYLHYGNMGCIVSSFGIQNSIVFCLKVKCFEIEFLRTYTTWVPFLANKLSQMWLVWKLPITKLVLLRIFGGTNTIG